MDKRRTISSNFFNKAQVVMPGGVNSPVRACKSVNMTPLFIDHADGCIISDVDGNNYIDYIGSWGSMIIGHRHPKVIDSITGILKKGTSYGAPTELEIELAELIIKSVSSVDLVRMVNSGTEATMSAIRLARGYTGRNKIIKFDGCYHGHVDSLLVEAGSGIATLGIPGSLGVPQSFVEHTVSIPFNNVDILNHTIDQYGDDIACVIIEPVAGNMGLVPANIDFLNQLRKITYEKGILLIFDEVMTGFRVSLGGAQELFGIEPDLTCFGKIIGGGLPVGAYGGRRDIMKKVAPEGSVYQAGTLSGNPLAMAAGVATLKEIRKSGFYNELDLKSKKLFEGLNEVSRNSNIPISLNRVGSMLGLFFNSKKVHNFDEAKESDLNNFSFYYRSMLNSGIYIAPSQFEVLFVSSAHDDLSIDRTINSTKKAFSELMKNNLFGY